jgi:3-hydroxyacyl-CoA dehydrogenase
MDTSATDPAVYEQVASFAKEIGMIPIEIKKEQAGFLLNDPNIMMRIHQGLCLPEPATK